MALDVAERTPFGPWHDYSRQLGNAEDAVCTVIEEVLMEGGTKLWQKYLERKAFAFAAGAVTEAVVSQLTMCFVAHDKGENPLGEEEWALEDEPEPGEVDSWARMHLPVRRRPSMSDTTTAGSVAKARNTAEGKRLQKTRTGLKDASKSIKAGSKSEKTEPRSAPIQEDAILDEEEERLREKKFQEEARRKDKERKAREAEKQKDEERRSVIALHEEMARKAHTFDTEGKIIWVEEIKTEKLPKVTETFAFNIKKDGDARQLRTESNSTSRNPGPTEAPVAHQVASSGPKRSMRGHRTAKGSRKAKADDGEPEFTDSFSKLQHGQPPILETMNVQPGVVLESMGKKKAGPESMSANYRQMSRKEYVMQATRWSPSTSELGGLDTAGTAGQLADAGVASSREGLAGGVGPAPTSEAPAVTGGSALLPPLQPAGAQRAAGAGGSHPRPAAGGQQSTSSARSGGNAAGPVAQPPGAPVQTAPQAPPMSTRVKRFEAVGNLGRPPRYHMPLLGGATGLGAPQPPLGATMGHGLIRHGSLKESYFFPVQNSENQGSMFRSSSDVSLNTVRPTEQVSMASSKRGARGGRSSKPGSREASQHLGKGSPSSADQEEEDFADGKLRPEASMAYRNFRSALFPNDAALRA